jgi:para-aminobenzoate synthetase component 1
MIDDTLPWIHELDGLQSEDAFLRLASKPHCLFLDSSLRDPELGRYSFVAADPYEMVVCDAASGVARLREATRGLDSNLRSDLPPFQGGVAGVLNYGFGRAFERLPQVEFDEFQLPPVVFGLYDVVIAFDHDLEKAWLISQGFPETEPTARVARSRARGKEVLGWLATQVEPRDFDRQGNSTESQIDIAAPRHAISEHRGLFSNFDRAGYLAAVQQGIDYISAGDIFQVNLSQRLLHASTGSSVDLYLRLRNRTPATFGGYFDAGNWQIASASPERFIQSRDGSVEARPIKGTRRQTQQPVADLFAGSDLLESEKDKAENVMIVDLLRNDLSRVCKASSIHVPQLCGLETYGYVKHLVSSVRGELDANCDAFDLIAASFPGGSITGAPKVRSMEIITELERVARGPYCGSLGYINWDGTLDLSILIRTITAAGGWWQIPVGGGIVAQSTPTGEYEETWHKAAGVLTALR